MVCLEFCNFYNSETIDCTIARENSIAFHYLILKVIYAVFAVLCSAPLFHDVKASYGFSCSLSFSKIPRRVGDVGRSVILSPEH